MFFFCDIVSAITHGDRDGHLIT